LEKEDGIGKTKSGKWINEDIGNMVYLLRRTCTSFDPATNGFLMPAL